MTPSSRFATGVRWTLLVTAAMWGATAHAIDITLGDPEYPLSVFGYVHSEHAFVDTGGNEDRLANGYYGWTDGYDHALRGSLLLNGHLSKSLWINGTLLYDSRYADDPIRAWDRTYWNGMRLRLGVDTVEEFWGRWSLSGRLRLDRDPNWVSEYPDSRLLMEPLEDLRLEGAVELRGPWATVRGGDVTATLGPHDLTLFERPAFGLHGTLSGTGSELDVVGAQAKGDVFFQTPTDSLGIPADGTAGPYRLGHSPIVRGSETIYVETRDRFDSTIVIDRRRLRRLIDYTIDYARGVVVLMEPLASETFDDDPNFLAIQYAYDARDVGFDRYVAGARGTTTLSDRIEFGLTYAGEFDDGDSWQGELPRPAAERRHVYGADATWSMGATTTLSAALVESDRGSIGSDRQNGAVDVRLDSGLSERLAVSGAYRRVESGFEAIANRFLVGQTNKERWDLAADLAASSAVDVQLHHRSSRDLRVAPGARRLTDRSTGGGTAIAVPGWPALGIGLELREIFDSSRTTRDERRTTTSLSASDTWSRLRVVGRYEYETLRERAAADSSDDAIHRLKVAPTIDIARSATWATEAKSELTRDRHIDRARDRRDHLRSEVSARIDSTWSVFVAGESRWERDLASSSDTWTGGDLVGRRYGYSLGANWRPHRTIETLARYEGQRTRDLMNGIDETDSRTYRQVVTWFPNRDVELSGEFSHADVQDLRKIGIAGTGNRRRDDEVLADLSYNHTESISVAAGLHLHRRRLYEPSANETWVRRVTLGANIHVTRALELVVEGHRAWLSGEPIDTTVSTSIENERLRLKFEAALDVRRHSRLAVGYERVDYQEPSTSDGSNDFDAGRLYLKLMGQM